MPQITAIKETKKGRLALFLDGEFAFSLDEETFAAADREVADLLRRCHDEALALLEANRALLDAVAAYLIEKETITGAQMMAILEGRDPDQEDYYGVPAQRDSSIEAPARHISMTSEPIAMPTASADLPGVEDDENADDKKPDDAGSNQ